MLADRVAREAYDAGTAALAALDPAAGWQARVVAQATALRRSISRHPGGAMMFAGSPKTLSAGALSVMERLLETLAEAGLPPQECGTAADTVLSHVTGYVLQEQSEPPAAPVGPEEVAELRRRFPRTLAAAAHDQEAQFAASLELLCGGIARLIPPGPEREAAPTGQRRAGSGSLSSSLPS
ncbi:TetR/AcrR family transcriptional regulator C-terminal domain-containing protein [Kitasatospora sp. NPDC094015]|uniref:TetR/AcrR family transcriptional regulator C-terminal domain-containing protein n=1 Tax=Kitasatospora sp. NPDC094015 TaxID=3155205 RepID=UPI003322AD60